MSQFSSLTVCACLKECLFQYPSEKRAPYINHIHPELSKTSSVEKNMKYIHHLDKDVKLDERDFNVLVQLLAKHAKKWKLKTWPIILEVKNPPKIMNGSLVSL